MISRRCTEPIQIKDIEFTKGMNIVIDVLSIHYDSRYWGPVDPEKFYPLRHHASFKRNPATLLSFGYGPRSKYLMFFNNY